MRGGETFFHSAVHQANASVFDMFALLVGASLALLSNNVCFFSTLLLVCLLHNLVNLGNLGMVKKTKNKKAKKTKYKRDIFCP
jgi:hypothetical protein